MNSPCLWIKLEFLLWIFSPLFTMGAAALVDRALAFVVRE